MGVWDYLWNMTPAYRIVNLIFRDNVNMYRDDSRFAPIQWETSLQSNAISHWMGTNLESTLYVYNEIWGLIINFSTNHAMSDFISFIIWGLRLRIGRWKSQSLMNLTMHSSVMVNPWNKECDLGNFNSVSGAHRWLSHWQYLVPSVMSAWLPFHIVTSSNENIFHITGPLWEESTGDQLIPLTGDRLIPLTKASDSELWYFFFDLWLNRQLSKQSRHRWFEMPSHSLWCHCNEFSDGELQVLMWL